MKKKNPLVDLILKENPMYIKKEEYLYRLLVTPETKIQKICEWFEQSTGNEL